MLQTDRCADDDMRLGQISVFRLLKVEWLCYEAWHAEEAVAQRKVGIEMGIYGDEVKG